MNIILVSGTRARPRTLTLTPAKLVAGAAAIFVTVFVLAAAFQYGLLQLASRANIPFIKSLVPSVIHDQHDKLQDSLRDSLNAMAARVGQMQAQLVRLDTLGERLASMAGFRDFMFDQPPGRGGADSSLPSRTLSFTELSDQLEWLNRQLDDRTDKLDVLHSLMRAESARKKLMPSVLPIDGAWQSSTFGWRIDPFNAARAFHEGMDLIAPPGTSVLAAASGVVIGAEFHAQYGNMVEIAHGNGLVTRYGHLSKSLVKVGDIVSSGGKIGEVGSTGRATGPHVHFEVRQNGAPLNPMRFLRSRG